MSRRLIYQYVISRNYVKLSVSEHWEKLAVAFHLFRNLVSANLKDPEKTKQQQQKKTVRNP